MSWIDILIIGIFILYIVVDFRRGLVNALASIISFILSLVIASSLYRTLYNWIVENTDIFTQINDFINQNFFDADNTSQGMQALDINRLPVGVKEYISRVIENGSKVNVNIDVPAAITDMLLYLICFLSIFFVVRFAVFVVAGLFDFIAKLPVLNFMNKSGGGLIGVIEGAIVSLVVINSIYTIAILSNYGSLVNSLNNSFLAKYFYIGYLFY